MPLQIKRLALLFAIFIVLFLLGRQLLIPDSFGEYGHYRGLSLEENAALIPQYVGQDACLDCHDDISGIKSAHEHAGLSCETCHGPGFGHVNSADSLILPVVEHNREFCLYCHALNAARITSLVAQVDEEHNAGQVCSECHNPHDPWEMMR